MNNDPHVSRKGLYHAPLELDDQDAQTLSGMYATYYRVLDSHPIPLEEFANRMETADDFGPEAARILRRMLNHN